LDWGDSFVVVPSVLSEFIHVVTDRKRFDDPMPMEEARQRARRIWTQTETEQLHTDDIAMECFFDWHEKFRLGRKRLHDTMLAATLYTAGVTSLLTLNPSDFRIFDCFEFHPDLSPPDTKSGDARA
jgi:predicted nucleic acid-binding protein